ncbi:MAG: tetraacyldisaccharide 4'-kinase, partial [Bacteroidetes bacterium]|nr:tetraacyldisaccharide 4'-kinase [Bacteroidota bacterium]
VLVLDDAFQHRYLRRDVNILVLDSRKDIREESLLPSGLRREPLSSLRRADLVVMSRVVSRNVRVAWAPALGRWYRGPIVWASTTTDGIFKASDSTALEADRLKGEAVYAFSGIANHGAFIEDLSRLGLDVKAEREFPDHHVYSDQDFQTITSGFAAAGCTILMTTEKDVARITADEESGGRFLETMPVYFSRLSVEILRGREILLEALRGALERVNN